MSHSPALSLPAPDSSARCTPREDQGRTWVTSMPAPCSQEEEAAVPAALSSLSRCHAVPFLCTSLCPACALSGSSLSWALSPESGPRCLQTWGSDTRGRPRSSQRPLLALLSFPSPAPRRWLPSTRPGRGSLPRARGFSFALPRRSLRAVAADPRSRGRDRGPRRPPTRRRPGSGSRTGRGGHGACDPHRMSCSEAVHVVLVWPRGVRAGGAELAGRRPGAGGRGGYDGLRMRLC